MDDDAPLSKTSAAAALKRDRATIRKALRDVPADADTMHGAPRWRASTVRQAVKEHDARVAAARSVNHAADGSTAADADGSDQSAFRQHRAEYMRQRAIAATRANEVAMGRLVALDEIEPPLVEFHATIRSQVLRVASCAPELVGRPVGEIFKILQDRIDDALAAISDDDSPEFAKLLAGIRARAAAQARPSKG